MKIIQNKKLTLMVIFMGILCFTSKAEKVEINKNLTAFTKVSLNCFGNLYLQQGDENSIKIIADKIYEKYIKYDVRGDTLYLETEERGSFWDKLFHGGSFNRRLEFYVTANNIDSIKSRASGTIKMTSDIKTKNLEIELAASGNIRMKNIFADNFKLDTNGSGEFYADKVILKKDFDFSGSASGNAEMDLLQADKIKVNRSRSGDIRIRKVDNKQSLVEIKTDNSGNVRLSGLNTVTVGVIQKGSGNVSLSGKADKLKLDKSSSGNFNAEELICKDAAVSTGGSGNVNVHVEGNLKVDKAGSGNLNIKGHPKVQLQNKTGSGSISM